MGIILFVFGLPGSGKSAAARQIKSFARHKRFRSRRFRDYTILFRMFMVEQDADNIKKRFRSTKYLGYDGFDVLDFHVLDEALQKLHHNIIRRKKYVNDSTELLIVEFSRIDYCKALAFFPSIRLNDAYFLLSIPIFRYVKRALKRDQTTHGPWMIVTFQIIRLIITIIQALSKV